VVDDTQSGRPVAAVTDVNIDIAEQLLTEDRRGSLRALSDFKCIFGKCSSCHYSKLSEGYFNIFQIKYLHVF
jgi:hypothetical protein